VPSDDEQRSTARALRQRTHGTVEDHDLVDHHSRVRFQCRLKPVGEPAREPSTPMTTVRPRSFSAVLRITATGTVTRRVSGGAGRPSA
jgi:hypothetical protein